MASRKRSPAIAAPASVHELPLPPTGQSPAEPEDSAPAPAGVPRVPPVPPARGRPGGNKQPSPGQLARYAKQRRMEYASKFLTQMREAFKANPPTGARARHYGRGVSSIEVLLSTAELAEYYQLLRHPATTLPVAHRWIKALGHRIGFCAVQRHRMRFRQRMADQRAAVEMSQMITTVAQERGVATTNDASAAYVEQQLLISLNNALKATEEGQPFDPRLWLETNKALGEAIKNRGNIEKLRQFLKSLGPAKKRSGVEIALRMREILGLPPPPPPPPPPPQPPAPPSLSPVLGGEGP